LELYSEIAISRKPFGIGDMDSYNFRLEWPILWPPRMLVFPPGTPCIQRDIETDLIPCYNKQEGCPHNTDLIIQWTGKGHYIEIKNSISEHQMMLQQTSNCAVSADVRVCILLWEWIKLHRGLISYPSNRVTTWNESRKLPSRHLEPESRESCENASHTPSTMRTNVRHHQLVT
jgi:hypothetical protein